MYKVIEIEGKKIPLKADGGILRIYRELFKKDLLLDINNTETRFDTEFVENFVYVLAKRANPKLPEINEWLSKFDSPFCLLEKADEIMSFFQDSTKTIVKSKSKKKNKTKKM